MQTGTFLKMSGEVEADETFIGGLAKNMHRHVRDRKIKGTGGSGKAAVLGIIERGGEDRTSRIKTSHVPNVKRRTLAPEIRATLEPGSHIYTDALKSYLGLSADYTHQVGPGASLETYRYSAPGGLLLALSALQLTHARD